LRNLFQTVVPIFFKKEKDLYKLEPGFKKDTKYKTTQCSFNNLGPMNVCGETDATLEGDVKIDNLDANGFNVIKVVTKEEDSMSWWLLGQKSCRWIAQSGVLEAVMARMLGISQDAPMYRHYLGLAGGGVVTKEMDFLQETAPGAMDVMCRFFCGGRRVENGELQIPYELHSQTRSTPLANMGKKVCREPRSCWV
jgi:hypothetical protein